MLDSKDKVSSCQNCAKKDELIAALESEVANLRAIEAQHKALNGQLRQALKGAKYAD